MHNKLLELAQEWSQRSDVENTNFNVKWLGKHVVEADKISLKHTPWIFSHVPKTAGTSLESYLIQAFELKDFLHINAPDLNKLPQSVFMKGRFAKLISGHHPIHGLLYQLMPDKKIVHLSMMRDPIARVVSYYNYIATTHYHSLHKKIACLSFDQFLDQADLVELCNGQAKRYAGVLHAQSELTDNQLYQAAKNVVDNCYTLVGVTEFFKQFHKYIAIKCGVTFNPLPPINRSQTKVQLSGLTQQQREKISQMNHVDIQLYHSVKAKFLKQIEL